MGYIQFHQHYIKKTCLCACVFLCIHPHPLSICLLYHQAPQESFHPTHWEFLTNCLSTTITQTPCWLRSTAPYFLEVFVFHIPKRAVSNLPSQNASVVSLQREASGFCAAARDSLLLNSCHHNCLQTSRKAPNSTDHCRGNESQTPFW